MRWYEACRGIKEYVRVLKAGTRVEGRRLQEAESLVKCLAFDAVTAWRLFSLDHYARDEPETPAAGVLTEDGRGQPFPPDIRSWVVLLARIAGW